MVRIIFLNPPSFMPSNFADSDGFFSLDLNNKEKIALTRVIDDYIDIGKIKQDTFREIDIPVTKKNRLLLEQIGNPSALNQNNNKIFDIQLLKGDFSYPVSGLQLVSVNESATESSYSVTIFGELNDWYRPANNLFLNELDLGSAVIDYIWINARHNDNYFYSDTNFPVFAPLVNYGRWFVECTQADKIEFAQVVFNNYRFWFSPLAILRQGFCQLGYDFICPTLEEIESRQEWHYLLDPNFETANQDDIADRPFEVDRLLDSVFTADFFVFSNGTSQNGVMLFPNVISDAGSHVIFNVAGPSATANFFGSFYSGGIIGNFNSGGTIRLQIASGTLIPIGPTFVTLTVSIKKSVRFGVDNQFDFLSKSTTLASQTFVYKGLVLGGIPIDYNFNLFTGNIKVYQYEVVFVQVELNADLVDGGGNAFDETIFYSLSGLRAGSFFKNTVEQQVIEEGDTIDFGKMMRKDLTFVDYVRGVSHLKSLKIETDTISKSVSMFPEFPFDWYRSGRQKAFFKENTDNPFDATNKIQVKSMQQTFKNTDLAREVYLKFADSTDGYITNQNLEQELHSKKIDLGDQYRDGENRIENPLFEPTDIGFDLQISGSMLIPFMWESEPTSENVYPDVGFDYAPRVCIAYLLANNVQFDPSLTGRDSTVNSFFVYEDTGQGFYNLFGQIHPTGITIVPTPPDPSFTPDLAVVYGNGVNINIADYYELFYERVIKQAYFGISLNFLVLLDLIEFSNISFRRKWFVKYMSESWGEIQFFARLARIDDYVIGENLTTPIELIPDNNNFINCE